MLRDLDTLVYLSTVLIKLENASVVSTSCSVTGVNLLQNISETVITSLLFLKSKSHIDLYKLDSLISVSADYQV